ncbi:MAG: tRNA pseudouridine(55) synthase TruB [Desulfobulbaceae bacterium]|nr:MAG: tRNA pseudouridine(55) synthase TruB [Desulfobulbaceae bacterium]
MNGDRLAGSELTLPDLVASDISPSAFVLPAVVLVDKPPGPSSFQMVQLVRRALGVKKVGHAGTLDPFASGLLIICVGRGATRLVDRLMAGDKEYEAIVQLGIATTTHDGEGEALEQDQGPVTPACFARLAEVLASFRGEIWQIPPAFSAVKHQGKPLYFYARRGKFIEKPPRRVQINELSLLELDRRRNRLVLRVRCSKGTYIRSLVHELGKALGCGAHLVALRRLASGNFRVDEALTVDGSELFVRDLAASRLRAQALDLANVESRLL